MNTNDPFGLDACQVRQDSREQDYLTSGVFRSKDDASNLHMFFSPYMMPAGMTDDEVRTCLALYARRRSLSDRLSQRHEHQEERALLERLESDYSFLEQSRESFSRVFGEAAFKMSAGDIAKLIAMAGSIVHHPLLLPQELLLSPMTRESFARGIAILTTRMDELEKGLP